MKKKTSDAPMIHVGVNKDSIIEAKRAVGEVLDHVPEHSVTPEVAKAALEALHKICEVSHVTIENCTLTRN